MASASSTTSRDGGPGRATAFDVIIIGAGAAGMMCAAQAGRRGRQVLLVEHQQTLGERIRISGGGKCNFSNRQVGIDNFLSRNRHFCRSAISQFSQHDFLALIERHGIAFEERDHGQLFCRDAAQDVIDMLRRECAAGKVEWAMPCAVSAVRRVECRDSGATTRYEVATSHGDFVASSLVIATGGLAVPKLGASPFGYRLAEQFALRVVAPKAALVPLSLAPELLSQLQPLSGVSLDVETRCDGEAGLPATAFRESLLLTHRGLSGPAVLQISSYWQSQDYIRDSGTEKRPKDPIVIDLLPGIDAHAWLESHRSSRALLATVLAERLPRRFAQAWVDRLGENPVMADLSTKALRSLADALSRWEVAPSGTLGYAKAEVTLGGVSTEDLSSRTMEARSVPGLYFIGEVVDVTGWLGGYNFQWAWSSGWVAGQYA